jgi:hypothetical protein
MCHYSFAIDKDRQFACSPLYMVFKRPETVKKKALPIHVLHRERIRRAGGYIAAAVAVVVAQAAETQDKQPMHTSALTGQKWLDEILKGTSRDHSMHPWVFICPVNQAIHSDFTVHSG